MVGSAGQFFLSLLKEKKLDKCFFPSCRAECVGGMGGNRRVYTQEDLFRILHACACGAPRLSGVTSELKRRPSSGLEGAPYRDFKAALETKEEGEEGPGQKPLSPNAVPFVPGDTHLLLEIQAPQGDDATVVYGWRNPDQWERHRVAQREKQLSYGRATLGYALYMADENRDQRDRVYPPSPHAPCSKRAWDGLLRQWRKYLHEWDPKGPQEAERARLAYPVQYAQWIKENVKKHK